PFHGLTSKRGSFLANAYSFNKHAIETAAFEQLQTAPRTRRQTPGLTPRGETAHEDAIVLRINHRCAVSQQRALADETGIVRENGQARPWTGFQRSEEHTSELQSPCNLVCRLLLEKKK